MVEWVAWFGLAGVIIPSLLLFIYVDTHPLGGLELSIYLFLFPTSMGSGNSAEATWIWGIFLPLILNSAFYSLVGYLFWYGLNKSKPVLYGFLTVFIAAWAFIFYSHS